MPPTNVTAGRRQRGRRSGNERGQVLLVFALMATVLIGFCGLALDAAVSHFNQRSLQETADGAALAGAYCLFAWYSNSNPTACNASSSNDTEAQATIIASAVAADDGCTASASCGLTVTYTDSTGAATSAASAASYVVATISQPHTNSFIQVTGAGAINQIAVTATAQVKTGTGAGANNLPCGLCLLDTGNSVLVGTHSGVSIVVSAGDLDVNGQVALSGGPSSILVNHGKFNVGAASGHNSYGSWTTSPAATEGAPPVADPLAAITAPSTNGMTAQGAVVAATNQTINPGIYGQLIPSGTVTFNPGVYVFIGSSGGIKASVSNAVIQGTGVTLFFTCGTYSGTTPAPAACAVGGQQGAALKASGSLTMNFSAPTSGLLQNMMLYYDRNNTSGITFNQNVAGTNVGAVYAAKSTITITNSGTFTLGSPIVAGALNITCCGLTFGSSAGVGPSASGPPQPGNLYQ